MASNYSLKEEGRGRSSLARYSIKGNPDRLIWVVAVQHQAWDLIRPLLWWNKRCGEIERKMIFLTTSDMPCKSSNPAVIGITVLIGYKGGPQALQEVSLIDQALAAKSIP